MNYTLDGNNIYTLKQEFVHSVRGAVKCSAKGLTVTKVPPAKIFYYRWSRGCRKM